MNDNQEKGIDESEKEMEEERSPYVSYKWLIGTVLSSFGILVAIIGIVASVLLGMLSSKVNLELYNVQHRALCTDIDDIKRVGESNSKQMTVFNANLILVLRALKIEPVLRIESPK
jgi:hypothetical protein